MPIPSSSDLADRCVISRDVPAFLSGGPLFHTAQIIEFSKTMTSLPHSRSHPSDLESVEDQDFSEEIPRSEFHIVSFLLSQIRPGMSLARITLPTFILETRSTLERLTDWMTHADILRQINAEDNPHLRALTFCTWIVSGFHMGPRTPKKPYNPILGECFRAALTEENGHVIGTYTAEQVSHHPPICAFHYQDREGGIVVWGHSELQSKFLVTSVAAIMDNENTKVNFEHLNRGETYEFNLPNMYGRGILTGKLMMEICGKVRVFCPQTGVYAQVHFQEKPILGGKYNRFKGKVYTKEKVKKKSKEVVHITFSGRWSAFMKCKDEHTGREWFSFDIRSAVPLHILVPQLGEQTAIESRFIWQKVTEWLQRNDTAKATDHKLAIEEKQRALVKHMKEGHLVWRHQVFHFDQAQLRFVPNALNLAVYDPSEPPLTMPAPFEMPELIADLERRGVTRTFPQIHEEVDAQGFHVQLPLVIVDPDLEAPPPPDPIPADDP
jgi:hypothetical protein